MQAGDIKDAGSIPGSERSPGGGNGNLLQYSCLENPMDRGAWPVTVHGIANSQTWLSGWTRTHTCVHAHTHTHRFITKYWRDCGQEEKRTTEDEMAGWHHRLDGREFEWTPGVGDEQGGLACCNSWGCKESDTTERLNWTEQNRLISYWNWEILQLENQESRWCN